MPVPYRLGALRRQWSLAPGGTHKGKRDVVRSHACGLSPWVWRGRRGARQHIRLRLRRSGIYGRKRKPGRLRAAGLGRAPRRRQHPFRYGEHIRHTVRCAPAHKQRRSSRDIAHVVAQHLARPPSGGWLPLPAVPTHHGGQDTCRRAPVGRLPPPPRNHRRKDARQRGRGCAGVLYPVVGRFGRQSHVPSGPPLSAGTVEHRAGRVREYQRQNGGAHCIRDRRRLWLCIVRRDRPVHCELGRYVARCHSTPRGAVAAAHGLFGYRQRATAAYYLDARRIGICNAARGCRRLWPGIV